MQIALIGEFEFTYQPGRSPALTIHHVVRGYDVLTLDQAATAELAALLQVTQKRIRSLPGAGQAIFGAGGDVTLFNAAGQRVCYLNADQAAKLSRLIHVA
ncbi:MAG: hypothetical protein HC822_14845 [Oscillochloris sp.]|nr:hypothetical protein [Oscillochloris sp.]